ncbi:MAG: haloacid dehalogenase-like hydrolase, partial [Rhodanobacteraceae bacterium]
MTTGSAGTNVAAGAATGSSGCAVPLVLFDFDGVLVRGDAFNAFLRQRFRRGWWRVVLALPFAPVMAVLACRRSGRLAAGRLLARCALAGVGEARYGRLVAAFVAEWVHG